LADSLLTAIESAYRDGFVRYQRVARAILRDEHLAWDAVQEGFAGAIRGRAGFRAEAPLDAWLWRAVVNAALRLRSPSSEVLSEETGELPMDEDWHTDEVDLARLAPRQRVVVFLRYYADLDERTIGLILGIERGTVSATLHTALRALRKNLEVSQ
jgi:RNA polymerase sigma factor (sigma-70 family)